MQILGYGEDALTLWAIKNKQLQILSILNDSSDHSRCRTFYRPSFGRSGGPFSSQFGEFDFVLLTEQCIYLGESKWDKSSEPILEGVIALRNEQSLRHELFKFYIEHWAFGNYSTWLEFAEATRDKLAAIGTTKPIAPSTSLLAANLQAIMGVIRQHYRTLPSIRNLLLYFYDGRQAHAPPQKAGANFLVVPIDYSEALSDNFIVLEE